MRRGYTGNTDMPMHPTRRGTDSGRTHTYPIDDYGNHRTRLTPLSLLAFFVLVILPALLVTFILIGLSGTARADGLIGDGTGSERPTQTEGAGDNDSDGASRHETPDKRTQDITAYTDTTTFLTTSFTEPAVSGASDMTGTIPSDDATLGEEIA